MAAAVSQNVDLASQLAGFIKMFTGSEVSTEDSGGTTTRSSTGQTTTKQTMFSQDAIDSLLKSLMERPDGLASIAGSSKTPGLYNSTTRDLMLNDFLARSTAEIAKATAPTVTTESPKTETTTTPTTTKTVKTPAAISPGVGLAGAAAIALGSKKGQKVIKDIFGEAVSGGATTAGDLASSFATGSSALTSAGFTDTAANSYNFMTGAAPASAASFSSGFSWDNLLSGGSAASSSFDTAMSAAPWFVDAASSYTGTAAELAADGLGGVDMFGSFGDALPFSPSAAFNFLTGDNEGGRAGEALALSAIPVVGPFLAAANAFDVPIVSDIVDWGGDVLKDVGDSIVSAWEDCFITTATCKVMGKSDDCYELTTLRNFRDTWLAENHPQDIARYYDEAPQIVKNLSARSDSGVILEAMYKDYIVPAVEAIQDGSYSVAYTIYKNLFNLADMLAHESDGE